MSDPTSFPGFSDPDHDAQVEARREAKRQEDVPVEPREYRERFRDPHEESCAYWDRVIARAERERGWL